MTGSEDFDSEKFDVLIMGEPGSYELPRDFETVDEYDNFMHVKATEEQVQGLMDLGNDIRPIRNLHMVEINDILFDTRNGEPEIPSTLRDDMTDLFIVQVRGPMKRSWLMAIQGYGEVLDNVRHHAYIVRIAPNKLNDVSSLDFVDWVGRYHPYYKIRPGFDGLEGLTKANIIFFKDDIEAYERGLGAVAGLGGRTLYRDEKTDWWNGARIEIPVNAVDTLARLDGLSFLEPYRDPTSRLNKAKWVIQSYDATNKLTPIWDHGINGTGIVVGGADTGIDYSHIAFRNSSSDVGTPGPDHRKIIQYNDSVDSYDDRNKVSGHGTHTMGALIGNNASSPQGYYFLDGIAYGAKLAFYDVVLPGGSYDPPIMSDILMDAYKYGAHSHSDSWGDDTTAYTARSQRIDQFQWDNYEFLTFIAPGNGGVVWEPATAKNCISVGNSFNGESLDIASSSAEGPANGNMINPHIVVPGMDIRSPRGDDNRTNDNFEYSGLSGTSMATPIAAGAGVLIEQYFVDGFYPTGTKSSGDGFMPSGALKKAALLNSGWSQAGGKKGGAGVGHAPNNKQGWGKVLLDDVLFFDGDTRGLWVYDGYNVSEGQGLQTGEKITYMINVNSSEPFEVTLNWNDYPGQGLMNDLDLTVLDPEGNLYRGNVYSKGVSTTGGAADGSNPTESVLISQPADGFYIINISAIDIRAQVHQRYALVITGAMEGANNGAVNFDKGLYGINEKVGVRLVDSDLSGMGVFEVKVSSLTETTPENLMLVESTVKGVFHGTISLSVADPVSDGFVQVSETDTIAVQYIETDPPGTRVDTAIVDGRPPVISNVRVTDITDTNAIIQWETDEPSTTNVTYGPSPALGMESRSTDLVSEHEVQLNGLMKSTLYFFDVASMDVVGNQVLDDMNGEHRSFRTASFIIQAEADYVGWVREGENFNHFTDGVMYSGQFLNLSRQSAMLFNLTTIPDNADIVATSVRLYSREGFGLFQGQGTWALDLLDPAVNEKFNGTTSAPNYADIATSAVSASIGQMDGPSMGSESWNTFYMPNVKLDLIEDRLPLNGAAFRIKGPTSGSDNMFSWDTGNQAQANSLGPQFAPQLVLTLNLIPIVSPGAPTEIEIIEDGDHILDLGSIFSDDGPLKYSVIQPPANIDMNITNATLDLAPFKDWNGEDYIIIMAQDNDNLYVEHRINITVTPVNDAPRIESINGVPVVEGMFLNGTQDKTMSFQVVATDIDIDYEGDFLFFDSNVSWFDINGSLLKFTPDNDDVGLHPISLSVRDIEGARDSIDVILAITNINDPPVAIITFPEEGLEELANNPVELNGNLSSDIDFPYGDNLTYFWRSSIQGTLGEGPVLRLLLDPGEHKVTLIVTDLDGATDFAVVNFTIWGDSDGDGIYDPEDPDDDDDGMPDYWEEAYGLDPKDAEDAKGDLDDDGFSNLKEFSASTDPTDPKDKPKDTSAAGEWNLNLLFILLFLIIGLVIGGMFMANKQDHSDEDIDFDDEDIDEEE